MTTNTYDLNGKIALVTGGSRGIGAAIVRKLAASGAKVVLTTSKSVTNAEALVKELGSDKVSFIVADSADRKSVRSAINGVVKTHGKLDILVNNAGVYETGLDGDEARYDKQNAINVDGVWAAVNEAAKVMTTGGRIVNLGSVVAEKAMGAGMAEYSATKAAVKMMTRVWAQEFGPKGITVNNVAPGPIDTDMNPATSDHAAAFASMVPLGRYGKAEEVASAVVFLASSDASYINGATLLVDGGAGV